MSTEKTGSTSLVVVTKEENPSFLTDQLQLKKLSKELTKATKEAIDILIKLLESSDEKVRLQAASKLLEFDIDVKKAISQDQMQRLIAEIKLNKGPSAKLIPLVDPDTEGKQKLKPLVDFSSLREV